MWICVFPKQASANGVLMVLLQVVRGLDQSPVPATVSLIISLCNCGNKHMVLSNTLSTIYNMDNLC